MCIVHSGYEIAFDEAGSWISCNKFAINGLNDDVNGSVGAAEQQLSTKFSKGKQNFASVCIIKVLRTISSLMENNSIILKLIKSSLTWKHIWKVSSQKKYIFKEIFMNFQSIMKLLINQ